MRLSCGTSATAATTFHPGDLIVGFNGAPVTNWVHLMERVQGIGPGVQVTFAIERNGQPKTLTLTTIPNPSNPE